MIVFSFIIKGKQVFFESTDKISEVTGWILYPRNNSYKNIQ